MPQKGPAGDWVNVRMYVCMSFFNRQDCTMETGMRPHTHVHLRFVGDKTCALYIYTPHVLLRFVHLRTSHV